MPGIPFTISGIVYDRSGTAISGATVILENCTTHESLSAVTSDANGAYEIEGSALASGITALDTIALIAEYSKGQSGEILAKVSAANLVIGVWDTADIYLRNGSLIKKHLTEFPISSIYASNFTNTARTIWFLDRSQLTSLTYKVVLTLNLAAAGDAQPFRSGNVPLMFTGGVRVIQCGTNPTNNPNELTAGVASAIGDTAKESTIVTIVQG